jgi:hypothetical protein
MLAVRDYAHNGDGFSCSLQRASEKDPKPVLHNLRPVHIEVSEVTAS